MRTGVCCVYMCVYAHAYVRVYACMCACVCAHGEYTPREREEEGMNTPKMTKQTAQMLTIGEAEKKK